jgi:hypothetical protein
MFVAWWPRYKHKTNELVANSSISATDVHARFIRIMMRPKTGGERNVSKPLMFMDKWGALR